MDTATLINGLDHPDAKFRLHIAHVNGLVEETRALPALHRRYAYEKDADVRYAIGWAGRRIQLAQRNGYNTLDALFDHYRITHELANKPILSSSVVPAHPHTVPSAAVRRISARQPAAVDVRLWIDRLMRGDNEEAQHNAALMLAEMNNPAALPYLGWVFAHLTDAQQSELTPLAQAVQRVGKLLYWGVVYWQMSNDGTLQQEIDLRRQQGIYRPEANVALHPPTLRMTPKMRRHRQR